jgi:hypothetical protein
MLLMWNYVNKKQSLERNGVFDVGICGEKGFPFWLASVGHNSLVVGEVFCHFRTVNVCLINGSRRQTLFEQIH